MKSTKSLFLAFALCASAFGSGTRGGSPPAPIPLPPVPKPDYAFECTVTVRSGHAAEYKSVLEKVVLSEKSPSFNTQGATAWKHYLRSGTIEIFERFEEIAHTPAPIADHGFYVRLDHTAQRWTNFVLNTRWSLRQDDGRIQWLTLNDGGDHTAVKHLHVQANLSSRDNQQLVGLDCRRVK